MGDSLAPTERFDLLARCASPHRQYDRTIDHRVRQVSDRRDRDRSEHGELLDGLLAALADATHNDGAASMTGVQQRGRSS